MKTYTQILEEFQTAADREREYGELEYEAGRCKEFLETEYDMTGDDSPPRLEETINNLAAIEVWAEERRKTQEKIQGALQEEAKEQDRDDEDWALDAKANADRRDD